MKKIVKNKKIEKATRKFTDRELPRKVFWDKYETIKQNKNNIEDIYIINYYGVGGIGKSSLLRKIIEELKEKEQKPYYVLHDFESAQEAKSVLIMLRNKIEDEYGFDFPLFDLAVYAYSRKIGESAEKPEVKSYMEKSRVLSFLSDGLAELPVVGIAAKILKFADTGVAILKSTGIKYKNELLRIENETAEETYKNLPYYFSQDLSESIEKLDKPFVILLDTYEKLVNELNDDGYSKMKDLWLRDDNGPILQIPGVLWVIAGREKIKWGEYDKDWEETLDQHILGDLSFNDANEFLEQAGIVEKELREEIYKLTNGTPVYLDICVDTYELLKEREEEITIDKFGLNVEELVERYIRYMDYQSSEMVYMLSTLENWNDDMIREVGSKILPGFSIVLYEKIKDLSFVLNANNNYYIHKTVKKIFEMKCPKMIKEKSLEIMDEYYYTKCCKMSVINEEYENMINCYFDNLLKIINEENCSDEISEAGILLCQIGQKGAIFLMEEKLEYIYNKLQKKYNNAKQFYVLDMVKAYVLITKGNMLEAKNILDNCIDKIVTNHDYDTPVIFQAIILAIYQNYPNYEKIQKLLAWLEKNEEDKYKEENPNTQIKGYISSKLGLMSGLYNIIGNEEKSVNILIKEIENKDITINSKCALIVELLKHIRKNGEEIYIKEYRKYSNELEQLLENDSENQIKDFNKVYSYNELSIYYQHMLNDYQKAYDFINKAEKIVYEKVEKFDYLSVYTVMNSKGKILKKLNKEQELINFCQKWYDFITDNFNEENSTINAMKIWILANLHRDDEKEQIYNKIYEDNCKNEVDIEELYTIAEIADNVGDKEHALKYANKILETIEKEGKNNNNISVFKDVILYILNGNIENDKFIKYLEELYKYYQENAESEIQGESELCAFYQSIGEYDKAYEILQKQKNIIINKYGEQSKETANIYNKIGIALNDLEENEKAIEYAEKSYNIYKELIGENNMLTIRAYVNMAVICLEIKFNKGMKMLEDYYIKMSKELKNEAAAYFVLTYIVEEKRAYNYDVDEVIEDMKKIIEFYDNAIGKNNYYVRNLLEVTQYFEEQ